MIKPCLLVIGFVLVFLAHSAFAVRVATLYEAKVLVASQSVQERNAALPKALENVLIKVSGNSQILSKPELTSQLNTAPKILQEFNYVAANDPHSYWLRIQFDADAVNQLLRNVGAPIWGQNRPLIIVWVTDIIDNSSNSELAVALKQAAENRGLPIIFPVMDVSEMNHVSLQDIDNLTAAPLIDASKRYGSDAILIGKITHIATGFNSQWRLVLENNQWDWKWDGKTTDEIAQALMDSIANTLSQRFAIVESHTVQTQLDIQVKGVNGQEDFVKLIRYLNHLTPVANVDIIRISGDSVSLRISLRGVRDAFQQAILPAKKLLPQSADTEGGTLTYQWNP